MKRYGLVVLGGGTGGLVAAIGAAGLAEKVLLVEAAHTGGDCLWTGCVPSKALLATADLAQQMRTADALGLPPRDPQVDFAEVMAHVRRTQQTLAPHDAPERLRDTGVEVVSGRGRFIRPGIVDVEGRPVAYRRALIATGSRPVVPPLAGLDAVDPLTTDSVWGLDELPERLVVLGGGPTGCELGQAFQRLGSRVTIVEAKPRLLSAEEPEASTLIAERLAGEGVDVRLGVQAVRVQVDGLQQGLVTSRDGVEEVIGFDRILVATGRRAATAELGLDTVGVNLDDRGHVLVDDTLRTSGRGVFAAGDVTGGPPFTHMAAHHGRVVVANALFGLRRRVEDDRVPWATYTDPEVGRVGLTEQQTRARWGEATVARFDYADVDRAVCAGRAYGFAKLIAGPRGRLVGATVAAHAGGEAATQVVAWLHAGATLSDVSQAVQPYPTFALGVTRSADEHLGRRWLSARTRRVTRPLLTVLRVLRRPR